MNLLLTILLDDLLPIFVVASVGFLLARRLHVDVKSLSRITFNALAPCLVFSLLVTSRVSSGEFGRIVAFTALLVAAVGLVARVAAIPFRLAASPARGVHDRRDVLECGQLRVVGRALRVRSGGPRAGRRLLRDERAPDVHGRDVSGVTRTPRRPGGAAAGWCGFRQSGGSWQPRWSSGRVPSFRRRCPARSSCSARRRFPACCSCSACSLRKARGPSARDWWRWRRPWSWSLAAHRVSAGSGSRPDRTRPAGRAGRVGDAERRDHHDSRAGIRRGPAVRHVRGGRHHPGQPAHRLDS